MKKRTLKLMAVAMVFALIFAFAALPASAENTYTPVAGGTTSFNKYLIIEDGADVPNKTFTYTIAPGTAISAANGKMAVLAGITDTNAPTVGSAVFANTDTIKTDTDGSITNTIGAKYAEKTSIPVNFTGVSFPEPGVYRYTLREVDQNAPYSIVSQQALTLDVYVTDNGTGLAVSSYVLHTGTDAPAAGANNGSADVTNAGDAVQDKTDKYVNRYTTHDITVSKDVSGNQASKDKYFKFTVTVPDLTPADTFNVDISDADPTPTGNSATKYSSMSNPTEVNGTQLASGVVFYLQDTQSVKILGLPAGATYTVTEDAEDYKPALTLTGDDDATKNDTSATGALDADITAAFTNTRDGIVPTGVLLTIAPFAIGLLLFGALAVFLIARKKRRTEDE